MMGQREFGEKPYYQFSLDRLVPDDRLLLRIREGVGFSVIRPSVVRSTAAHPGPAVAPR